MPHAAKSSLTLAKDHLGTQQALVRSGIPHSVLGNNWYFENLFYSLPAALKSGHWYTSAGDGCIGYISREDCARVAAAVLASDTPDAYYDVAGETALTTREIAFIVREVTGAPLEVVDVTDAQLTQGLIGAGVPEPFAYLFAEFDRATREGDLSATSDVVKRLTGRAPDTLRDFVRASAQALTSAA
jgi:NAD(P)H dehydrogenase (quinone)